MSILGAPGEEPQILRIRLISEILGREKMKVRQFLAPSIIKYNQGHICSGCSWPIATGHLSFLSRLIIDTYHHVGVDPHVVCSWPHSYLNLSVYNFS